MKILCVYKDPEERHPDVLAFRKPISKIRSWGKEGVSIEFNQKGPSGSTTKWTVNLSSSDIKRIVSEVNIKTASDNLVKLGF